MQNCMVALGNLDFLDSTKDYIKNYFLGERVSYTHTDKLLWNNLRICPSLFRKNTCAVGK